MKSINERLDPSTVQTGRSVLDYNPRAGRQEAMADEHGPPASPKEPITHQDRAFIEKVHPAGDSEVAHAGTPRNCRGVLRLWRKRMSEIVAEEERGSLYGGENELYAFTLDNGARYRIVGGLSNSVRQFVPEGPESPVLTMWAVQRRWNPCKGKRAELATADLGESVILRRVEDGTAESRKFWRVT